MITYTNKHALPEAIVRAVANDPYSRGDSDFSVTQLLQPPQMARLAGQHETPEDVSDRIWALLGQAVHVILERAGQGDAAVLTEKRLFMEVTVDNKTYRISGALDHHHLEQGCLTDYKITSVYARAGKDEWIAQLNLLRLLLAANNHAVHRLQNVLIFRDWRPKEAVSKDDYPASQVATLAVPLWPMEKAVSFLHQRIRDHVAATPRPCTDDERWKQPDKIALMKRGRKTAIKLFEGKATPAEVRLGDGQFWEQRPGGARRCESYCPVAAVCPQWAAEQAAAEDLAPALQQSIDGARAA